MNQHHVIALGGIGGDSHSVGLILLRWTLQKVGYRVIYLGTQNSIEQFFAVAPFADVVMVSCLDGHARHYLRDYPRLLVERRPKAIWYLGGNPIVEKLIGDERRFVEMGFLRVFLGFVDLDEVLRTLEQDLAGVPSVPFDSAFAEQLIGGRATLPGEGSDDRIADVDHSETRRGVLQHWPTGAHARNLEENAEWLRRGTLLSCVESEVLQGRRRILLQPRTGVATPDHQLKLFQAMVHAGANVLSFQIDSFTRNNNYVEAGEGIRDSVSAGYSTINGYPAINHGVVPLRHMIRQIQRPLQFRHSARDPRLLAEIAFAGGVGAFEGGAICYNIPYYRDYPVDASIRSWQYVDRLCGRYYDQFGLIIHREFFGVLTGTLVPPAIAIATGLLEALLAAMQGVRAVGIGFAEVGCRYQDIATIRAIKRLGRRVLDEFGFKSVHVSAVFNQYMAAFPMQIHKARMLIEGSAGTAALGGATRLLTKTAVEAIKIPSISDNIEGLTLNTRGIDNAVSTTVDEAAIVAEQAVIERETLAIVERTFEVGRGSLAKGIVEGFRLGTLDVPFAPSLYNAGAVMAVRDISGALRYLSVGNLPLPADIVQMHTEKVSERRRAEGLHPREDYRLVERDLLRIARGQFDQWPLG